MRIEDVVIRACPQRMRDAQWKFARAAVPAISGHVVELRDEAGTRGLGYAHAIPAITVHGEGARSALELLRPVLLHQPFDAIGPLMEEIERALAFHHSVKAAVDMALHDLLARRLGVPISTLLGGRFRAAIPQSRIVSIKAPAEMARQAAALAEAGYAHLKLKLSGDAPVDIQRVASVREAVGPALRITLDPNQSYAAKDMMRAFRAMERHDIALLEQPVPAGDWAGLALLSRTLPVAVEADESAGSVHDVQRLVGDRVVDAINLKVSKLGGFRRFVEAVHLCEAGSVACRVGAAFGPSLMQAMHAHAASVIKSLPHACELSEHQQLLDDPFEDLLVERGVVNVPAGPGAGILYRTEPLA